VVVAGFNAGTQPGGGDSNILKIELRATNGGDDRIEVTMTANSTDVTLEIVEWIAGVDNARESDADTALSDGENYFLVVSAAGDQVTATIYNENTVDASKLGTVHHSVGPGTMTTQTGRGLVGYEFLPHNFDFLLYFIALESADYARFESKSFGSLGYVVGASLNAFASAPSNLIEDWEAWGDATATDIADYTEIVRDGTEVQGGIVSTEPLPIGDTTQVFVTGELYPVGAVNGTYRVAFIDENDVVAFIGEIGDLRPNQWNEFTVSIGFNLLPIYYYFYLQQTGLHSDTFRFRNLGILHNTIKWEASANDGTNWQPFLNAINMPYSDLRFINPGRLLRVRGTALTTDAWIQGYELIPRYLPPGRNA
jgi:hypothetical protein